MNQNNKNCRACFVQATDVSAHAFVVQSAAIRYFAALHDAGDFPVMCQAGNDKFHVCHEISSRA